MDSSRDDHRGQGDQLVDIEDQRVIRLSGSTQPKAKGQRQNEENPRGDGLDCKTHVRLRVARLLLLSVGLVLYLELRDQAICPGANRRPVADVGRWDLFESWKQVVGEAQRRRVEFAAE